MRTLRVAAILTKRQMIDNAAYLVPAVVFSLVFVPAVVIIVLMDESTAPSLHAVAVFVALPVFICLGSCALGIVQAHGDRVNGISALLSTLPVTRFEIHCVRVAVGIFLILVALVPLALAATILWQVVRPPAWLVRDWRGDVFSGMLLVALASYSLGLSAGTRARTLLRAFGVMPLPILLVLLIVAKGFGWPLLCVLLVILVTLVLASVKADLPAYVGTGTLGLLALVFACTGLFGGRFLSDAALARRWYDTVEIHPSGLFAQKERTSDSPFDLEVFVRWTDWRWQAGSFYNNLYRRRGILSALCLPFQGSEHVLRRLGIAEYIRSRKRGDWYVDDGAREGFSFAHLDCTLGRLVYRYNNARTLGSAFPWDWERATVQYIGPDGISDAPGDALGRFGAPLIGGSEFVENREWWSTGPARHDLKTFTLFDVKLGCFFFLDLEKRIVSRGPELAPRSDEPVRVGAVPGREVCSIDVRLPRDGGSSEAVGSARSPYVPVICRSGRIELLDRDSLEVAGVAGTLPRPSTLFGRGTPKPHDLLASDVVFIATDAPRRNAPRDPPGRGEYVGAVAASMSRDGMSMSVAVFDKRGKMIESRDRQHSQRPGHLVTKYIFESLHPPILTLASFFTAYSFEAGATHRALFLMPNSFVAQQRDRETMFIFQFFFALLFLLPALVFAGFLSWRVVRDAAAMGLPRNALWLWGIGTLAFGLPAYITHRLARPHAALALCRDCGQGRRVDQEVCHHCGSGWSVPALEPPAWRVISP
jgi:hypothetical protein